MKKILMQLCSAALLIVLCLSLFACDASEPEPEEKPQEKHSYVADLRTQVKKNPTEYNGKGVDVKGGIFRYDGSIYLLDHKSPDDGTQFRSEFKKGNIMNIKIIITDENVANILETGDYVSAHGTVRISDEGIYLDECTVTITTPREER